MDILIVAHGKFAEGLKSALNIILGDYEFDIINAYVEEIDFKKELKAYINSHDEICILTDLFGGSVNQEAMKYLSEKVHIISGVNLPLALEIIMENKNGELSKEKISTIISNTKKQIMYINTLTFIKVKDDFE